MKMRTVDFMDIICNNYYLSAGAIKIPRDKVALA
jgi:hypothetical protein